MKKLWLLLVATMLACSGLWAQGVVTGKVTDADNGQALEGVAVVVKGTTVGILTDEEGAYRLQVPDGAEAIEFNFIGKLKVTEDINGRSSIDVAMSDDIYQVDEVVVTAIGIQREKKSLGYAVQEVSGDEIVGSKEPNLMAALSGKVAGLQVNTSNGTPGAGSYILLRGATSFSDINQPLIVIDGIPVDNSTNYTGDPNQTSRNNNLQGVTNSNRGIDINPNDIQDISVLKGPAAAALYGSRAANGAIMITTKRGSAASAKKMEVSFSTSLAFDQVNRLPEVQKTYSQGSGGAYNNGTSLSWGARIDTLGEIVNPVGETVQAQAYDNDFNKFFQTGVTTDNNLSFRAGDIDNNFFTSIGYLNQSGVIPNTDFERLSIRVNAETKVASKLRIRFFGNYTNSGGTRAQQGSNLSNPLFTLWPAPPTWDLYGIPFENPDGTQNNYRLFFDNPRWAVEKNPFVDDVNRTTGNIQFVYDPLPWLNIMYRAGSDFYSDRRKQIYAINSWEALTIGRVYEEQLANTEINSDLIVTLTKDLGKDINTTLVLGNNINHQNFQRLFTQGDGLTIPDFYNINNATSTFTVEETNTKRSVSVYFDARFSFKNYLFLSVTGRNDWSSTLAKENRSYFYPSVAAGFVFTDAFGMSSNNVLPYGKIRASWAKSANDAPIYALSSTFNPASPGDGWTTGLLYPLNGNIPGFTLGNTAGNPNLTPEFTTAFEVGLDLKFFRNRLGFDATYYNQESTDQIVSERISSATGTVARLVNVGRISNKGFELQAYGTPVKGEFTWDINLNFTRNRSMVEELSDGIDLLPIAGFTAPQIVLAPGQPYGSIYGSAYLRDDAGNILIDDDETSPTYGYPIIDQNNQIIGNTQPNWLMGIRNTLTWKGFRFSFLLDIREGGDLYAGTTRLLRLYGAAKETEDRTTPQVITGVKREEGTPNDIAVPQGQVYNQIIISNLDEANVFETSWVRLRDISLSYSFPRSVLGNSGFEDITITASGRNLWLSTDYPNLDPEVSLTGSNFGQGLEYMSPPNTKGYAIALRLTF